MKRRKVSEDVLIYQNNSIRIVKESNREYFFEIKNEITTDLAEAVSLMMRLELPIEIWNTGLNNYNISSIEPEKCLYWLSGGNEWVTLEHYKLPWASCYLDFQEEFGIIVIEIIKRSKTFADIRDGFRKYLNLPTLYEFALSKGLVK